MVKDRLLDLLSREEEDESHGEDVVRLSGFFFVVALSHSGSSLNSVSLSAMF